MQFLSSFNMLGSRLEISITIALLAAIWFIGKRYFFQNSIDDKFPKLTAVVNIFIIPLTVLLIGNIIHSTHKWLGFGDLSEHINTLILLALLLALGWCIARLVEVILLSRRTDEDATYLPGLQRVLLFVGFLFISSILFLNIMDYSITGIYVSTGAVAALVAFAMQRTLGDLFSGIALSIEHPFRLGDWIELEDGTQGQIIDINWRATRLRGWDKTTIVVPNSTLAQQRINNMHGSNHVYAQWYEIKVPSEVDPRITKALLLEAALRCDKILKKPLPAVRLADASTMPYIYSIWVHFPNYMSMFAGREQLFREIHYAFKTSGIRVAPEIHELHTQRTGTLNVDPPTTLLTLKGLDIANLLTDEELQQLIDRSDRLTFDAGTVLVSEGEVSGSLDIIVHGIVETSIMAGHKTSKTIDEIKPGQYYGLYSMITDGPSFQKFTAATDVTIIRVHMEHIRELLMKRPDLQEEFARIVKQRMDAAQKVRMRCNKALARHTFQDILHKIESLVR